MISPIDGSIVLRAAAIGIGGTLAIDLWNWLLRTGFQISSLNYCLLGRWLAHLPSGRFRHESIAAAAAKPYECALGWMAHYSIGIGLTLGFVGLVSIDWIAQPTVVPALGFGIATVGFPFFVLQPALGLGVASGETRSPWRARLKSLGTHTAFGLGIYLSALALRQL